MVKINVIDGNYICSEIYDDFKKDYLDPHFTQKSLISKYGLRVGEYRRLVKQVKKEMNFDRRGFHSKNRMLWNVTKVYHNSKNQKSNKPSKSFYLKYDNRLIKVGGFIEPISCEILYDIIKENC